MKTAESKVNAACLDLFIFADTSVTELLVLQSPLLGSQIIALELLNDLFHQVIGKPYTGNSI